MDPLLEVNNLSVDYITMTGSVRAVDDVSFTINPEEILGLAGESGCGKSTIAYSLMRLHRPPALISEGQINLGGTDVLRLNTEELRKFRWEEMSMVFQSAMNCLNPVVRLDKQFFEIFKYHGITNNKKEAFERSAELMKIVDIAPERLRDYPHQFSGGMRQRAIIAMALALKPKLLILDEPTTALDTVVQREILQKIYELKQKFKFSILFITHDLSLMMEFCDTVAVMYAGKIVEMAPSKQILNSPRHPYTYGLKNSFPSLKGDVKYMEGIAGSPVSLSMLPKGCRFQDRCFNVTGECRRYEPQAGENKHNFVCCHNRLKEGKV